MLVGANRSGELCWMLVQARHLREGDRFLFSGREWTWASRNTGDAAGAPVAHTDDGLCHLLKHSAVHQPGELYAFYITAHPGEESGPLMRGEHLWCFDIPDERALALRVLAS